jgi:hypothetical protein
MVENLAGIVSPTHAGEMVNREGFVKRNVVLDIMVDDNLRQPVIQQIRLYRAACRKAFAACAMAEMAGAEIITDTENGDIKIVPGKADESKKILEAAFGVTGKAHLYQLRKWLLELHPSWLSIVPESIFRDIVSPRWRAKDPEFPKATRGYLTLNGAREMSQFNHIGIAVKNTIPKLNERSFTIKWDYEIGPVEFRLGKLDASRWHTWRMIQSGCEGWKLGTIYVGERDGKLRAVIGYTCPDKEKKVDPAKEMRVEFGTSEENAIVCSGDGRFTGEVINVAAAVAWLKELEAIRADYLRRLGSHHKWEWLKAGENKHNQYPSRKWTAIKEKLNRLADRRKNGERTYNHLWTKRIVDHAIRLGAGKLVVVDIPDKEFFGQFWGWYQFKQQLKYKIEEVGGTVSFIDTKAVEAKAA